jgi:hypothetical protein
VSADDIVRLNYGTHFREWWREIRQRSPAPRNGPSIGAANLAYRLLGEAQHFLLPAGGRILDHEGKMEAKYAPLCHLPFPITAFEFQSSPSPRRDNSTLSTKRIALCVDSSELNKRKIFPAGEDEWGCMSIFSLDDFRMWAVPPFMLMINRSETVTATKELLQLSAAYIEEEREFDSSVRCVGKPGDEYMSIGLARFPGAEHYPAAAARCDMRDEVTAAIQACAALACSNMGRQTLPASAALNEKRQHSGKEPFVSYHILDVAGDRPVRGESTGSGSHNSPRQHLRRGHIRRLDETRVTWVTSCVVGTHGKVIKDYRVQFTAMEG